MRVSRLFQILFLRKNFARIKKHKNVNKQTKIKKGSIFMRLKTIGKKLLMCLFTFLCFFMPFMSLLGYIFVPFLSFMPVKSFCKKGSKWPDCPTDITTKFMPLRAQFFNLNVFQLLQPFLSVFFITIFFITICDSIFMKIS